MKALRFGLIFLIYICLETVSAQTFSNIALAQNILVYNSYPVSGNAISFYDFDKDGWDDLTFGTKTGVARFFRNNEGNFEEVTLPGVSVSGDAKMVCWVDYDNDGDADFYAAYSGLPIKLFRNDGDMTFTDVSDSCGFDTYNTISWGSSWGDFDRDGDLDLYAPRNYANGSYPPDYTRVNRLYSNDGDGTFTDITLDAGVHDSIGISFHGIFWDYNLDRWPDIYVINDKWFDNGLYRNNQDGTFADSGEETNLDIVMVAMCAAVSDYDRDGDFDIYITNTASVGESTGNALFNNDNGYFTNVNAEANVQVNLVCWGSVWFDYDNDGWEDLYVISNLNFLNTPNNKVLRNNGDGTFTDVSLAVSMHTDIAFGYTNCTGDINNDGYPDLANNNTLPYNAGVFLSSGGENNFIKLSFEGTVSNRDAIGTNVKVYAGGQLQMREIYCGENYMSQNSQREIFGLGLQDVVDSVVVAWPSGFDETWYNLNANQTYHLVEGASIHIALSAQGGFNLCEGDSLVLSILNENPGPYYWQDGTQSESITIYESGIYYAYAVNEWGVLSMSAPLEVVFNPLPEVEITMEHPVCQGDTTGSIGIENQIDTPLSNVAWNHGDSGSFIQGLSAGIYGFLATDSLGCQISGTAVLQEGHFLEVQVTATHPGCHDLADGAISIENISGSGIGSIVWNNGAFGSTLSNLIADTYHYTITDTLGCWLSGTVPRAAPPAPVLEIAVTDLTCHGAADGSIEVSNAGETGFGSILWNTGAIDPLLNGLEAESYSFVFADSLGCSIIGEVQISEPEELLIAANLEQQVNENCINNWIVSAFASGGTPPYEFSWLFFIPGEPGATLEYEGELLDVCLPGQAYEWSCVAVDGAGCESAVSGEISVPLLLADIEQTVLVYPNPVYTTLNIPESIVSYTLTDVHGKILAAGERKRKLDFTEYSAGMYFLHFQTSSIRGVQQVMKE